MPGNQLLIKPVFVMKETKSFSTAAAWGYLWLFSLFQASLCFPIVVLVVFWLWLEYVCKCATVQYCVSIFGKVWFFFSYTWAILRHALGFWVRSPWSTALTMLEIINGPMLLYIYPGRVSFRKGYWATSEIRERNRKKNCRTEYSPPNSWAEGDRRFLENTWSTP